MKRVNDISTVVVPAAGLGTRLLPATKEQPKEMLPIFATDEKGQFTVKPLLQQIFEQLFDFGFRNFCFIVGREKRAIEDHFTSDLDLVQRLESRGSIEQAIHLREFYTNIEEASILWINQPAPKGFGDAVLRAERAINEERFLVHAGDTYIQSKNRRDTFLSRLTNSYLKNRPDAIISIKRVKDPRDYGVAEVITENGNRMRVKRVVEKPDKPRTNFAIMPLYIFQHSVFDAIRATAPGKGGEIQLTDAIQELIDTKHDVRAIRLTANDIRLEVGTPDTYWSTLQHTHSSNLRLSSHEPNC